MLNKLSWRSPNPESFPDLELFCECAVSCYADQMHMLESVMSCGTDALIIGTFGSFGVLHSTL